MASPIQTELLAISSDIARTEMVAVYEETGGLAAGWANTTDFTPGLYAIIRFVGHKLDPNRVASAQLAVDEPRRGLSVLAVTHSDEPGLYEDEYAEYFLSAFRNYATRQHSLVPAGMSGYYNVNKELTRLMAAPTRSLIILSR